MKEGAADCCLLGHRDRMRSLGEETGFLALSLWLSGQKFCHKTRVSLAVTGPTP
jgi:hypothetical protein